MPHALLALLSAAVGAILLAPEIVAGEPGTPEPAAVAGPAMPAVAGPDEDDDEDLRAKYDELASQYEQLARLYIDLQARLDASDDQDEFLRAQVELLQRRLDDGGALAEPSIEDQFFIPRTAAEFQDSGVPQSLGNIYTRPFLRQMGSNTYLGGYIDLEYTDSDGDADREFDQHRFVPFIYADVSDRVKVAAEIEYEHGSELEIEFAQMDYLVNEHFNLRGGIMLLPLGKLNAVHDSPIQDLTARPLVNRYIIPTTLRDAGVGAWGSITDNVNYELTITNGFKGLNAAGDSVINSKDGLRNAAPQSDDLEGFDPFENVNDDLAYTGRVAWQPVLGMEVGGSMHHGKYDETDNNELSIFALDATIDGKATALLPDNVEVLYEGAWTDLERDAFAEAAGVPNNMGGYYIQTNVHFEPDFLGDWIADGTVDDGAHFTFVTRWGEVDLGEYEMRRLTFGLNFRPNASQTVFKLDYQHNDDEGMYAGDNTDDVLLFSMATYF